MPRMTSEMPAESNRRDLSPQASAIAANLRRVQERVRAACQRAGRSPDEVTLIGISKGFPVEAVVAAHAGRPVGHGREPGAGGSDEDRSGGGTGNTSALASRRASSVEQGKDSPGTV